MKFGARSAAAVAILQPFVVPSAQALPSRLLSRFLQLVYVLAFSSEHGTVRFCIPSICALRSYILTLCSRERLFCQAALQPSARLMAPAAWARPAENRAAVLGSWLLPVKLVERRRNKIRVSFLFDIGLYPASVVCSELMDCRNLAGRELLQLGVCACANECKVA